MIIPGSNKTRVFKDVNKAREAFEKLFHEKTGNKWENRKQFVKKPKLFDLVEMDTTPSEIQNPDTRRVRIFTCTARVRQPHKASQSARAQPAAGKMLARFC